MGNSPRCCTAGGGDDCLDLPLLLGGDCAAAEGSVDPNLPSLWGDCTAVGGDDCLDMPLLLGFDCAAAAGGVDPDLPLLLRGDCAAGGDCCPPALVAGDEGDRGAELGSVLLVSVSTILPSPVDDWLETKWAELEEKFLDVKCKLSPSMLSSG